MDLLYAQKDNTWVTSQSHIYIFIIRAIGKENPPAVMHPLIQGQVVGAAA